MGGFVAARPEDQAYTPPSTPTTPTATPPPQLPSGAQGFVPARPEDQTFVPARPQDATPQQPPTAPPPPRSLAALGQIVKQSAVGNPGTVGAGAMKTIRKAAAGLVEMADAYLSGASIAPGSTPMLTPGGKADQALASTSQALRQNTETHGPVEAGGAMIPDMMAFAVPELWGEKGAAEAMSLSDRVLATGRNLKTLEKNPGLLNILKQVLGKTATGAGRAALPAATMTSAETGGDPEKTLTAAGTAAAFGALSEGIPATAQGIADVGNLLRPTSEAMEGVTMPVAADQKPGASPITKLANTSTLDEAQQAATPQIIENGAKRAVKNVLDEVNTTRGAMHGPAEAPGGPKPGAFKFSVAPFGEPLETTDPFYVKKLLGEAQDLQASPQFDTMGPRAQAQVTNQVESLSNQLDQYHTELATRPHYTPIDVDAAVRNTEDYGTAGQNIQDSIDDVYQRMRGAANEQLDKKWLKQLSPSEFEQLMEQNTDKFSPEERQVATDTYRKGVALKDYHKAIQQGFNVSPQDAAATASLGGQRTFTGSDKIANDLDNVIAQHGDDLRSMVGDRGISTVRRLNQLMKDPDTSDSVAKIIHGTATILRRHMGLGGLVGRVTNAPITTGGALLGTKLGGLPGTAAGAAAGAMLQKVVNTIATSPMIGDRIAYGAVNKISTRVVAPIIARMILRHTDTPQPQEQP